MQPITVNITGATEITGLSRSTFYNLFRAGTLTPIKHGKRVLIKVDELNAYIESLPVAAIKPLPAAA